MLLDITDNFLKHNDIDTYYWILLTSGRNEPAITTTIVMYDETGEACWW